MDVDFLSPSGQKEASGTASKDQVHVIRGVSLIRNYGVCQESQLSAVAQDSVDLR